MSLRTGVTCAPEDTQRALTSTQCGSADWHTPFLPGLWVSCHLPSAHCASTSASVLWKWAATATGEVLATRPGASTHLTRASLTDALFAFKVSIETMLIMLSSALAPFTQMRKVTRLGPFGCAVFTCPCFPSASNMWLFTRAKVDIVTPKFVPVLLAGPHLEEKDVLL